MTASALRAEERAAPYLVAPPLTEHLDTFASAPEGFKRLRELVLNLAVRGRLVPQDTRDEPAERLFERIQQETRLLRTASAKKRAASKLSERSEYSYELPPSWLWTQLEDVFYSISPSSNKLLTSKIQEVGTYPVVDQGKRFIAGYTDSAELLIRLHGPVVVFGDHTTERKFIDFDFVAGADGVKILRPICLNEKYFYWFVVGQAIEDRGYARHYRVLVDRPFPLPPLVEQSRIVAKVEELMVLIDTLEAKVGAGDTARGKLLDTLLAVLADSPDAAATAEAWKQFAPNFDMLLQTPADVDRLQQTLLALAVKGRLVPQDPNDEPAAELLKRIRAEKVRLVTEGKIKPDKPLPAIAEDEVPYPIPISWCWVRLPEICHDWGQKVPDGPFTYIDVGAIDNERGVISDAAQLLDASNAPSRARKVVRSGTVLYSTVRPYLLNITIVDRLYEPEPIASTAFAILHPLTGVDGRFLFHYLRSQPFTDFVASKMVGVAYPAINDGNFFSGLFPLPPLAEQTRIVAAVASLTALCDRLRERLAARRELSAKLAAALTESALA